MADPGVQFLSQPGGEWPGVVLPRARKSTRFKVLDPGPENPFPGFATDCRVYVPRDKQDAMVAQGEAGGDMLYEYMLPYVLLAVWAASWSGFNEPYEADAEARRLLDLAQARWMDRMRPHKKPLCLFDFSVGCPPEGVMKEFTRTLARWQPSDFFGLHEYGDKDMRAQEWLTWKVLRFPRHADEMKALLGYHPRVLITEASVDITGGPGGGYLSYSSWASLREQLRWYAAETDKYPYVCGIHPYAANEGEWWSFRLGPDEVRDLLDDNLLRPEPQPYMPKVTGEGPPKKREKIMYAVARPLPGDVGRVSQWFGTNPSWYAKYGLAGHNGLDYAAPAGTPILATHDGEVVAAGFDAGGYGNFVRLKNAECETIYGHMSVIETAIGRKVKAGEQIGRVGSTGNSTGNHLHFGLRLVGVVNQAYSNYVDPMIGRKANGDA